MLLSLSPQIIARFCPPTLTQHTQTGGDRTLDSAWLARRLVQTKKSARGRSQRRAGWSGQPRRNREVGGDSAWKDGGIEVLNPSGSSEKRMTPMSSQDRTLQVIGEVECASHLIKKICLQPRKIDRSGWWMASRASFRSLKTIFQARGSQPFIHLKK